MRATATAGALGALLLAGAATAAEPAAGLALQGVDGRTVTLSLAEVAALPRRTVHVVQHGQPHDFAGPAVADLLGRVGAPLGAALRGRALGDVVVARGRDGYAAALSLAECDPAMRPGAAVVVADREDGGPLAPGEGPLRLVVEGDARPARAVRMLAALRVVDAGAAGASLTQP